MERSGKFAEPCLAVSIKTGGLFLDVLMDFGADNRRKLCGRQNAINCGRREAGVLVVAFEYGPSGASRQPERIGLLVERAKSGSNESLADFPNFGRLFRLHFNHIVRKRSGSVGSRRLPTNKTLS